MSDEKKGSPKLPVEGKRNILITSALPYVNNVPHLGNLIGCVLSADVYSRFCRVRGHNSIYICGTDEYGTATETKARQEGLTPRQICDKYNAIHQKIYEWFQIDFDQFGRTTNEHHAAIAQEIFTQNDTNGNIVTKDMQQLYCAGCDLWLADRYVEGQCPKCDAPGARGDQCDACGQTYDAVELKDPQCAHCSKAGRVNVPEQKTSTHLFLNLPKLSDRLTNEYVNPSLAGGLWTTNTRRVTQAWLKEGLQDRCVSRDLKWGTPVPKEGFTEKVFYVWFDAPIGYVSITAMYTPEWRQWWHNPENVELVQFMGKDNIPFHTVIFPCSQLGTGTSWTMGNRVSTTEYLNYETGKFSKSRSTGVFGDNVQESGIPADVYRYYLLRTRPENADSVFDWTDLLAKNNNELVANLGNFVNRSVVFTHKFFDGKVPDPTESPQTEQETTLAADVSQKLGEYVSLMEAMQLKDGLSKLMEISKLGNGYLQKQQPWVQIKTDKARASLTVYTCLALARLLAAVLHPYMPSTSDSILRQLCLPALVAPLANAELVTPAADAKVSTPEAPKRFDVYTCAWLPYAAHGLEAGTAIGKAELLVQKIDKKVINKLRAKYSGGQVDEVGDDEKKAAPQGPPFNAYMAVGQVLEAKAHPDPDASRLYVLQVQMTETLPSAEELKALDEKRAQEAAAKKAKKGKQKKAPQQFAPVLLPKRQIVSGLAEHYTAEELVGKKVVVLVNLQNGRFKGQVSEGMLLTAIHEDGDSKTIKLLTCDATPGTQILPEGHSYKHKKALRMPKDLKALKLDTGAGGAARSKTVPLVSVGPTAVPVLNEGNLEGAKIA